MKPFGVVLPYRAAWEGHGGHREGGANLQKLFLGGVRRVRQVRRVRILGEPLF